MNLDNESLGIIANIAAILTFAAAVFAYCSYRLEQRLKRKRLEEYLKNAKHTGSDRGQRSLLHLMAKAGMTESELLNASFSSNHISRKIAKDENSDRAQALLLEWKD